MKKLTTAQHTALSAITDVSRGRGARGIQFVDAVKTFRLTTLRGLQRLGFLHFNNNYTNANYFKTTRAGFAALAA